MVGAGQAVASEDQSLVDEAIDAGHARLRKFGLVPFALSAIPEWAQVPLRDYVAGDVAQSYGFGGPRLGEFKSAQRMAERDLARQVSGFRHPIRIKTDYF